jgi:Flp pilus assembly protein TadG
MRLPFTTVKRAGVIRRFRRNDDGSAAIEFGVVALPFFAVLFAIIETALVFFGNQILETANADAARLIMTGQAQAQSFDATKFKANVCGRIKGLMDCAGVIIDVKAYKSFATASVGRPTDAQGKLAKDTFGFDPGTAGDIVVVRAMYEFPIYVSMLGLNLADMSGGKRLLLATAAFRNEPFK